MVTQEALLYCTYMKEEAHTQQKATAGVTSYCWHDVSSDTFPSISFWKVWRNLVLNAKKKKK